VRFDDSEREVDPLPGEFAGFLDHFSVTFDGLRKRVTLKPNGTFPSPVFDTE
jgi:hypothetical protein